MKRVRQRLIVSLLALLTCAVAWAQDFEATGTIISATDNEPLMGASILEVGTSNGCTADFDGNFKLKVSKEGAKLRISFMGCITQELPAAKDMQIVLEDDNKVMDEVIVTGYQTQRKIDLTGAVSAVDAKHIKTVSTPDPMTALQGRIAGVTITPSNGADPNGTGVVRIRGIGSFNADQTPLFIIDGVPTTQTLNSLNAADIESMQVLKDAASASIYGSRAANGVIVITTKKGKEGAKKVNVQFDASVTAQFYSPQSMMKLMNSQDYATAMVQAALNDGLDPVAYAKNFGLDINAASGTPIRAWNPATNSYNNYVVNGAYDGFINTKRTMRYSDTDWLDAISRTGTMQNYNLSLSHASEKTTTMFSLGYKHNEGIIKYTDFDNLSARINTTYKVNLKSATDLKCLSIHN